MNPKISRRDFLKWMPIAAGAGLASAYVPRAAPSPASAPSPTPYPCICPTPTPTPIPRPTPVNASFDVYAYYLHGWGLTGGVNERTTSGYTTVTPLYGSEQNLYTMKMDVKWAREHGVMTFVLPTGPWPDTPWEHHINELFLPASEPPFDINYSLMFNPPLQPDYLPTASAARVAKETILKHIQHPRYKKLPDGRPVVFYILAGTVAYLNGIDELEHSVDLLRRNLGRDVFLVGEVMTEPYAMRTDSKYQDSDYVRRQVKPFDAITSYYLWHAGVEWHSDKEYHHVVTSFTDMINGYKEAFDVWANIAHQYGVKFAPPISPAGISNRLLWEAGLDSWLSDQHEGVNYDTAKQMAELGAQYAEEDLKIVVVGAWNECSEGAAIVPSKGFKFGPAHAVRDTFAIEPSGGWPKDYYPPS